MTSAPVNLMALVAKYSKDEDCREALKHLRWPDGVKCLRCQSEKVAPVKEREVYVCYSCQYQFSVTVGTIFQDTHLPLTTWFFVTYLMTESRKGISANQVKRMLGIGSYKTAWYLCHRIRAAMAEAEHKMTGTVEIDETYIGGKQHGHRRQLKNKSAVIGIRERGGHVHFIKANEVNQLAVYDIIAKNVGKTVDVIMTDESKLYNFNWTQYMNAKHKSVNHSADEYVRYERGMCVSTNGIESAFSLLKRGIVGTWHQVSAKHLQAYLQEMTWRFNNRKNPHLFRDTMQKLIQSGNIEYKELTKAA
jgi:transposase-like protein